MRSARSIGLLLVMAAVTACTGGSSPAPSPTPNPSPDQNAFVLRATMIQALPPDSTFAWLPLLLITADGRAISVGPTDAMFPGKLLPNLLQRSISQAGWTAIANAAKAAGLLAGNVNFTGGNAAPGSVLARLELVVDGKRYDLTGDPTIPPCVAPGCPPAQPGTQRAFAEFWSALTSLDGVVSSELGPEQPYVATSYAILVGPTPNNQGLNQAAITWPLKTTLATFGKAIKAGDGRRCGTVSGADAATLRPLLQAATQISPWFDNGETGAGHGLVVRPLLPGDADPCAGLTA